MKKKTEDAMVQSAVWLPRDLHQRLKRAGGEGGMGEEIRARLAASFEAEKPPANPKTRELLDAIAFVADKADLHYGNWSEDAFAFAVLKASVDLLLAANQPKGEAIQKANPNPDPDASGFSNFFFDPSSTPENIGRFIIGNWMWATGKRPGEGKPR